ncbi:hypothetical protein DL93DRAFT_2086883, partial [Clavulina sp. PMI_390]
MTRLPQLIAEAGGPEDEEETHQMFTLYVTHPIRFEDSAQDRPCHIKARRPIKPRKATR